MPPDQLNHQLKPSRVKFSCTLHSPVELLHRFQDQLYLDPLYNYILSCLFGSSLLSFGTGQAHINFLETNNFKLLQSLFPSKYEL
jgi:hypothetical protein